MESNQNGNDKIQVFGRNLKSVLNELHILNKSNVIYKQSEGCSSQIWELWDIEKKAWEKLDTLNSYEEKRLMFKYNAFWYSPSVEIDNEFRNSINALYGLPDCEFEVSNKSILAWFCGNNKNQYKNLCEYFIEEMDILDSGTILKLCVLIAEANNLNFLDLLFKYQK